MSFIKDNSQTRTNIGWAVEVGADPSSFILRGDRKYESVLELGGTCYAGSYCALFNIINGP